MTMRKLNSRNAGETTLRHVWLAGLGLVSVVRHGALSAGGRLLGEVAGVRQRAGGVVERVRSQLLVHLGPIIAHLDDGIGARFAPALRKQVMRPRATAPPGRKPTAK